MLNELLVFVGTYTDPILFGTGKVLEGKGEGIYVYKMNPASGAMELIGKKTDVTNPSYLAFDPARAGYMPLMSSSFLKAIQREQLARLLLIRRPAG